MRRKEPENYPLVSIIIDNWDGKQYLKDCLSAVFNQNYPNFEVIVVDDASSDGSAEFIQSYFPRVKLLINRRHVGFAIANNQGIKISRGKYLLLLNNDTEVTKDFLFPLVDALEKDPLLAAAQSRIRLIPEKSLLDEVASYLTPLGFLYHVGFFEKDQTKYRRKFFTFSPKGACFFLKKEILDEVGLLDERFYCYFEESDLAWRIWLSGHRITYVPRSLIYHYQAASQKKQTRPKIDFFSIKNRLNSICTNLSFPYLFLILPLHLLTLAFFIFYYLITLKIENLEAVVKAIFWNIKEAGPTLRKRKIVQKKIRKISDLEMFKYVFKTPPLAYYLKLFFSYQRGRQTSQPKEKGNS